MGQNSCLIMIGRFLWRLVIFQIKEENDLLLTSYDASQFADVVKLYIKDILGCVTENLSADQAVKSR